MYKTYSARIEDEGGVDITRIKGIASVLLDKVAGMDVQTLTMNMNLVGGTAVYQLTATVNG